MLIREYPKEMLDAGVGGVTIVELTLDEDGVVQGVGVHESSGHAALDEAALRVASFAPFTRPVLHNGRPTGGKITVPVRFDADEAMAADACEDDTEPYYWNRRDAEQALTREYPAVLRDRGIGGRTDVWLLIDEGGRVTEQQVKRSSGYGQLDGAALRASRRLRFAPATHCGEPVAVWVAVPVSFTTR